MSYPLIETIEYKGYNIEVIYDQNADSPDEWGYHDAFIVHDHRMFSVERKGFDPADIFEDLKAGKTLYDGYHIFPLYAYIHSGVALSLGRSSYPFTCNWDTSFAGFVLVKKTKGWSWRKDKAETIAKAIVKEWNCYLSGDVYGYSSEVGSVWGFYGSEGKEEMIKDAKSEIDYEIQKKTKTHFEQLKTWIKNKVPLLKRQAFQYSF